jgi:hypothetical protein
VQTRNNKIPSFSQHQQSRHCKVCEKQICKCLQQIKVASTSRLCKKFARNEFANVFNGSTLQMDMLKHHVGSWLKENEIEIEIEASALKWENRRAWCDDDKNDEEKVDDQQQQTPQQTPQQTQQQAQQHEQKDEEEKVEEDVQTTTATALAVNLTEGRVADPKETPAMNLFQIPGGNT